MKTLFFRTKSRITMDSDRLDKGFKMKNDRTGVKSAYRAMELLELLSLHVDGLKFAEIVKAMGLAKSTGFELIHTMEKLKYISFSKTDKKYRITSKILSIGANYVGQSPELQHAKQIMSQLYEMSGATVKLAVLSDQQVVIIEQLDARGSGLNPSAPAFKIHPLKAGSLGKALLSRHKKSELKKMFDELVQSEGSDAAPRTWAEFCLDIEEIEKFGLAFETSKPDFGKYSASIPIYNFAGEVVAAVGVFFDQGNLTYERIKALIIDMIEKFAARESAPAGGLPRDSKKTVYVTLPNLSTPKSIEYLRTIENERMRIDAEFYLSACHDNECKQQLFLELMIKYYRPDCIIICPVNAVNSDRLFQIAAQNGIPAVCFLRPSRSRHVEYYVGGNSYQQGILQMEYVARRLKGRGNIVILEGDPYNDNARNIVLGNHEVLRKYPQLQVLLSVPIHQWRKEEAKAVISEIIAKGMKFDAVLAGNDHMALGVIEELRKHKLNGKVIVVGGDGDWTAIEPVKNRVLHATVFQYPHEVTIMMMKLAADLAHNRLNEIDLPKRFLLNDGYPGKEVRICEVEYDLIDRTNIQKLEDYWKTKMESFVMG